jgi:hypothetical protein
MILRLLNWQGIAGIAISAGLAILLVIQKVETGHWKKQSANFEQLYRQEQASLAVTIANARAAAEAARAADRANAARVTAEQQAINQRTSNDFEARLAAARAAAQLVRLQSEAAADPRARAGAPVPGVPAAAGGPAESARQDRLPANDALTATEQAIQLDELIKWVWAQAGVKPNDASQTQH